MAEAEVNARWQESMAPFFVDLDQRHPDQGMLVLDEVFHLQAALDDAGLPTGEAS